tara:strand:- start:16176 stop:16457 length:282 start_codon:yes stop_codon:yes gene_type:complete
MKITVTNTPGIMHLVSNASGRGRCVHEDQFSQTVDPDGTHVMGFSMIHNEVEMRTQWICKMRDTEVPSEIWLDVDFEAFKVATTDIEVENESR